MIYDADFTALTFDQFVDTARPYVAQYKESMGRKDSDGRTKASDIEDARNALTAHCKAWAITKKRKTQIDEWLVTACYE